MDAAPQLPSQEDDAGDTLAAPVAAPAAREPDSDPASDIGGAMLVPGGVPYAKAVSRAHSISGSDFSLCKFFLTVY